MKFSRARWIGVFLIAAGVLTAGFIYRKTLFHFDVADKALVTKSVLANALGDAARVQRLPTETTLPIRGKPARVVIQYSIDSNLQEAMEGLFRSYAPDYGALVAIDPSTGRILSMVSYVHNKDIDDNLALRATFPSASIFKVVTAAAAIAERNFSGNTVISFNGRNHTLYRSNILKTPITRWTRHMTLKEAFAHSVNTVFGKIGAYTVGADGLRQYASRFGFNRAISSDIPLQAGYALIPDDPWSLAEAASGYTRDNTMSPMQGALIAATVANDGAMMEPYLVQSVHAPDGKLLYAAEPRISTMAVDPATAAEIRDLMRETVTRGTSRKSFRGFFKGTYSDLNVGGKTGSLTGYNPVGKYDWFIGFAENGSQRFAVAALTVHRKYWRVKSSYLARRAIETYFHEVSSHATVASIPSAKYSR